MVKVSSRCLKCLPVAILKDQGGSPTLRLHTKLNNFCAVHFRRKSQLWDYAHTLNLENFLLYLSSIISRFVDWLLFLFPLLRDNARIISFSRAPKIIQIQCKTGVVCLSYPRVLASSRPRILACPRPRVPASPRVPESPSPYVLMSSRPTRIKLCLLLWWGLWKTMKLLLSVRGDFSVRWLELRLGLSRLQSANFQWWQFGSLREPTRENTDRLTVGECVNVGRFSLIYNFSDLRRLIHTTRFELGEYRFLEPSIFRTNFRFPLEVSMPI